MMNKDKLKKKVIEAIDNHAEDIIEIGDHIWGNPELGYKEYKTAEFVESKYKEYGWTFENKIALTGSKAYLKKPGPRPTVGINGDLDAVRTLDHPECDPTTGAVHACGHCAQIASMLGAGIGLTASGVIDKLDGNVTLQAVPAEEYLEIGWRNTLREKGTIEYFGGKQEFIRLGKYDDVDIIFQSHTATEPYLKGKLGVGGTLNGFIGKMVRYIGLESHAGAAPHQGINALNAALLGLMGIHAQRETFKEEDTLRVHPIITKGGEITNNVPADVRIETYVRGKTIDAIVDANKKVNRALQAGADAVGAQVEINDVPGYMPWRQNPGLVELLQKNCELLVGAENVVERGHATASNDGGDISGMIPAASFMMGGASGVGHGRDFTISDKEFSYVIPSKVFAMTCVDLLYDNATIAKKIIEGYEPSIPRKPDEYNKFWHKIID